jgi:hypothetical protein
MMTNQCPLVEWYKYKNKCTIATCKFNTQALASGCIAIERLDTNGKKLLTDRELCYYKFNNSISVVEVTQHRKKVMQRVKRILTLHYYVQYIHTNVKLVEYKVPKICLKLLRKPPFKLAKLNINEITLCNMLNVNNFNAFKQSMKLDSDFHIWDVFFMTQKKWEAFNNHFLEYQERQ